MGAAELKTNPKHPPSRSRYGGAGKIRNPKQMKMTEIQMTKTR